jgi:hypothetical protein
MRIDPSWRTMPAMARPIVIVGVPTSLGGHLSGTERTPVGLRELGLVAALRTRPMLGGAEIRDAGDLAIDPGFVADDDPRAKNRARICEFLPRERASWRRDRRRSTQPDEPRFFVLGGDCTANAGRWPARARPSRTTPGDRLVRCPRRPQRRPTPSGNIWGMPFAMLCGRGDPDLVSAADGPSVDKRTPLLGDRCSTRPSREIAASRIAHLGPGCSHAGRHRRPRRWALRSGARSTRSTSRSTWLPRRSGGWALTMPETGGLSLPSALAAVRTLASAIPVAGFGATAVTLANGDGPKTVDAIAQLAEAAFAPG